MTNYYLNPKILNPIFKNKEIFTNNLKLRPNLKEQCATNIKIDKTKR